MKEGGMSPEGVLQREAGSAGGIHPNLCLLHAGQEHSKGFPGIAPWEQRGAGGDQHHHPNLPGAPDTAVESRELLLVPGNEGLLSWGFAHPWSLPSSGAGASLEGAEWE